MARWNDLVIALGNAGARDNAAQAIAQRHDAEDDLDLFLQRFAHPAGSVRVPSEPVAREASVAHAAAS